LIDVFQIQETATFTKYKHALLNRSAPPRKKLDVGKDTELKIYKKMLDENSIDVDEKEPEPDSDDEDEDLVDSSDEEDTQRMGRKKDTFFASEKNRLISYNIYIQSTIQSKQHLMLNRIQCNLYE
ncbi:hypothetical protein BpHYR1_040154, partial [Brachionus plicatilis]